MQALTERKMISGCDDGDVRYVSTPRPRCRPCSPHSATLRVLPLPPHALASAAARQREYREYRCRSWLPSRASPQARAACAGWERAGESADIARGIACRRRWRCVSTRSAPV